MNDTELAFRCLELAVKAGAAEQPQVLAERYFATARSLIASADKPPGPATAGKTARPKPAKKG